MAKSVFENVKSSVKTFNLDNLKDFTEKTIGFLVNEKEIYSGVSYSVSATCPENTENVFRAFKDDYAVTSDGWVYKRHGEKFTKFYYGVFSRVEKVIEFNFGDFPSFGLCSGGYLTIIGGKNARIKMEGSVMELYGGTLFKAYKNLLRFGDKFDETGGEKDGNSRGEIRFDACFGNIVALSTSSYGLYVFQENAVYLVTGEDRQEGFTIKKLGSLKDKIIGSSVVNIDTAYFISGQNIYRAEKEKLVSVTKIYNASNVIKCSSYLNFYVITHDNENTTRALLYDTVSGDFTTLEGIQDVSLHGVALSNDNKLLTLYPSGAGEWQSKEITIDNALRPVICGFDFYTSASCLFKVICDNKEKVYSLSSGQNHISLILPSCKTKIYFKSDEKGFKVNDVKILYRD